MLDHSTPSPQMHSSKKHEPLVRARPTSLSATGLSELLDVEIKIGHSFPRATATLFVLLACLLQFTSTQLMAVKSSTVTPIVVMGQPGIHAVASPVDVAEIRSPRFQKQLEVLKEAMQQELGAGIAAPQIGWNASVFVVGVDSSHPSFNTPRGAFALTERDVPIQFWINPVIRAQSEEQVWAWEGCFSVPGMRGWVRRPASITLEGYDSKGVWRQTEFHGLVSRLVQHEYSHLEGNLFTDRVTKPEFLVSKASFEHQSTWPANWPSPGARDTGLGAVSTRQ